MTHHNQTNRGFSSRFILVLLLITIAGVLSVSMTIADSNLSFNNTSDNIGNSTEPFVDPEIWSQLENKSEVKIIVYVKDNTGIIMTPISDAASQERLAERTAILSRETDAVLSQLSPDEFNLTDRFMMSGRGFYGYATREAVNKIINMSDVYQIWFDGVSYATDATAVFPPGMNLSINDTSNNTDFQSTISNNISNISLDNDNSVGALNATVDIAPAPKEKGKSSWFSRIIEFFKSLF